MIWRRVLGGLMVAAFVVGAAPSHAEVGAAPTPIAAVVGHPVTRSYAPILGTGATVLDTVSGTTTGPTPSACQAAIYCDLVPLTVGRPPGPAAGLVLSIELTWKTTPINLGVTGTNSDVMELEVWAAPHYAAPVLAARSAHSFEPASVTILAPSSDLYDVVVENGLGVNQGFQLTVSLGSTTGYTPTAPSVETPSSTGAPAAAAGPPVVPTPIAIGPATTTTVVEPAPAPAPSLEPTPTLAPDLGVIGSPLLAAAPPTRPARSPSGAAELVWFLALPALIVTASAITLSRRGRGARRDRPRPRRGE